MTARRLAPWLLAALVLGGVAFAVGLATSPDAATTSAASTEGPHGVRVPPLGGAAKLPAMHEETVVEEPEEVSGTATSEVPPSEESYVPPVESSPQPEESAPSGGGESSGGSDIVPET